MRRPPLSMAICVWPLSLGGKTLPDLAEGACFYRDWMQHSHKLHAME